MKICDHCGQPIQEAHKEVLSKMKLTMLKSAAAHVIATEVNDFKKSDIAEMLENSAYGNFQKLRYHGLVTPARDKAGNRVRGRWLITRNGWAFLRGELDLPKFVLVRNNHVVDGSHSKVLLNVRDVYRGSDAIVTTFEYFDHETGEQIGYRPTLQHQPIQGSLL